ncbi:MAG TPA: hypothetical protein VM029_12710 [Opitutaceae bacterium]|nr:hypothetical protein [Opitutaceae bacterium]
MYDLTMIHLTADARSASIDAGRNERRGVTKAEMRALLENFCALDALENASADPEMRIQSNGQSYLVRTELKKLIFFDMLNRDAGSHALGVDQVMAELDGTAAAARAMSLTAAPFSLAAEPVIAPPAPRPRGPRLLALAGTAAGLLAAIIYLRWPGEGQNTRAGFVAERDAEPMKAALAGVYLTGTQPGQHGIVYFASGELRLFQLRAVEAPGLVHARAELGRVGSLLCLATDQPGGLISIPSHDTLVYCGETYRRVP